MPFPAGRCCPRSPPERGAEPSRCPRRPGGWGVSPFSRGFGCFSGPARVGGGVSPFSRGFGCFSGPAGQLRVPRGWAVSQPCVGSVCPMTTPTRPQGWGRVARGVLAPRHRDHQGLGRWHHGDKRGRARPAHPGAGSGGRVGLSTPRGRFLIIARPSSLGRLSNFFFVLTF